MWKLRRALSWQANPGTVHARRAVSGCWAGRGNAVLLRKRHGSQLHSGGLAGGRSREGKRRGHSCKKLCHWLISACLHTFASWWVSQNICVFWEAAAEACKCYCDWHYNIICWGCRQASVVFSQDISLVKSLLPQACSELSSWKVILPENPKTYMP